MTPRSREALFEFGWKTALGTALLLGLGVYLIGAGTTSTWDNPNAGITGDLLRSDGRLCLVLAFVFFGLRAALAKVLRRLREIEQRLEKGR
jgi:formate hydrogenlyase subunit 3/multisubunit Na+/H+ antiporter MnhD subunit